MKSLTFYSDSCACFFSKSSFDIGPQLVAFATIYGLGAHYYGLPFASIFSNLALKSSGSGVISGTVSFDFSAVLMTLCGGANSVLLLGDLT